MFAVVLILTCLPPDFKLSRALVDQCCYLISQRLNEDSEVWQLHFLVKKGTHSRT
jgi:HEAT repeat-containing protein 5